MKVRHHKKRIETLENKITELQCLVIAMYDIMAKNYQFPRDLFKKIDEVLNEQSNHN